MADIDVKSRIIELLTSTKRNGVDALISYLENNGFFILPASLKNHSVWDGGLAEHSLSVYEKLLEIANGLQLDRMGSVGQLPLAVKNENLVISTLLHDVCKIGAYVRDGDKWKRSKNKERGHGVLSIDRIKKYIELEPIEEMMIRYHMGVYGLIEYEESGEYPLRSDQNLSKKKTYGVSLANVWFHNPITKLLYFADELATMMEKREKVVV